MSSQPSSFVGYIENYGINLWRPFKQQYPMSRNGHRPKWSWTEMVMGRNDPEPLYNMSRDVRKQTLCICENKDAKPIRVFVFAKWIVQSLYFLNLKFQWSRELSSVTVQLSFCYNCLETSMFVFSAFICCSP